MADRIILTIGTRKGVFVAEAAKTRRSFTLRGPMGPGVPVYSTLIDTRGTPRLYSSSCGSRVNQGERKKQAGRTRRRAPGHDRRAGRPRSQRRMAGRSPTSGLSKRAPVRRICGAEWSRRLCSEAATAAIRGKWSPASAITITRVNGAPAPAACACTPSFAMAIGCTLASRPVDTI